MLGSLSLMLTCCCRRLPALIFDYVVTTELYRLIAFERRLFAVTAAALVAVGRLGAGLESQLSERNRQKAILTFSPHETDSFGSGAQSGPGRHSRHRAGGWLTLNMAVCDCPCAMAGNCSGRMGEHD